MGATLRQQLEAFEKDIILDSSGEINDCYNFYDWFCSDKALKNKSFILMKQVKRFLKHHPEINLDKHYVFFKNNCPCAGSLYDDFRIVNIEKEHVVFTVTPRRVLQNGNRRGPSITKAELWGRANDFEEPIKEAGNYLGLFK